jgi:alpha-1,2-mannosyltransferase
VRLPAGQWLRLTIAALVGGALVVLAAKAIGRWYYDPTIWPLAGWYVPPDFGDFYAAAEAVLRGDNPYQPDPSRDWLGFVYPPLLAWLLAPLTLLPVTTAVSVWAALTLLFVVAALWVLGVRDWRCYPLALLSPFARETLEFGAIDGLLLLAVALTWKYRDAPLRAAAASGFTVALKLFLWPLALWLGLSGRVRTAVLSCAAAVGFVLVPWALIGFQGLGGYRELLRDVANQQDGSYSLAALAEGLDVASTFARTLSVALAVLLLFLSFRAARDPDRGQRVRDRRSFTLALAASLTLTPVVWNHYLLLLFVPVAIARPRLSGLWVLPAAANCLYLFDWYGPKPNGLAPRIAMAAIVVVTIVLSIEAQARPRSSALGPVWARLRRGRFWRSVAAGLAFASVLAAVFVATPELLNDRPYNPLGRDTSHAPQSARSGGDFGQE